MKRKNWAYRVLLLTIIIAFSLSMVSYASLEASHYLSFYGAYISRSGNTVYVNFDVQGTRIMDKVGVTEIYLYERSTPTGSWSLVQTYLSTDATYSSSMIGTNTGLKIDSVSYAGSASKDYFAYVTCYAEKDGGSDSRDITTPVG